MKILYVCGDDYAAMHVEDEIGVHVAAKLTEEAGGKLTINNPEVYADLKILEFGEVDSEFISFIYENISDYDMMKHANFYVIEESES